MPNSGSQYKIVMQAVIDEKMLQTQMKNLSKKAKLNVNTRDAQKGIRGVTSDIKTAIGKTMSWAVAVGAVYGALNQLKEGITFISDLNNAMTQIRMVSGMTADETERLAVEYNDLAKELKATTLEVSNGALEWVKQGKTAQEAQALVTNSIILSKLAMMESAQATEYLTSIMNGFKLETEDMIGVLDKLVAVDNESATSVGEIAEALKRSSSSARQAGVDFETLVGYVSTVSSVTRRSASSIGESFKTMFARMQQVKLGSEFDEFGEDISNVEIALRGVGIEVRDNVDEFRDLQDVISELAGVWDTLTTTRQGEIAQAIAGKRQRENFLVLMDNFNDVLAYQEIQADSAGLALERFAVHQESVAAAQDKMRATWESMWIETLNSDTILNVYEMATGVLEFIEALGGLEEVLKAVIILVAAFNAELILAKAIGFVSVIQAFVPVLISMISQFGLLNGVLMTFNTLLGITVSTLAIIATAGIFVFIAGLKLLDSAMLKAKRESVKFGRSVQNDFVKSIYDAGRGIEDIIPIVVSYRGELEKLREEYEELSWWQKQFVDLLHLEEQGSVIANIEIANRSKTYEDYLINLTALADVLNVAIADISMTESAWAVTREKWLGQQEEVIDGMDEMADSASNLSEDIYSSSEALSDMQKEMKSVADIIKKSSEGGITYDDIIKLSEVYENYIELLVIEGGIVKLNTDKLKEFSLAKANHAIKTAFANRESKETIDLLINYRDQLARAIPMTRNYTGTFQELLSSQEIANSGFADLAYQIAYVSDQFEDGEISVEGYFDSINEHLENLDFEETFGENQEAAQIFFAGLTQDATQSLLYINSLFNAGEISIADYTSRLTELGSTFTMLGDFALNFAEANVEMQEQIGNAQSGIAEGLAEITQLQEINQLNLEIAYKKNHDNMVFGSEQYANYMRQLAEATIATGYVFTDLTGKMYTSTDELTDYLSTSEKNFGIFADATAKDTAGGINNIVQAVGKLLVAIGQEISNFDAEINFEVTKVGTFNWDALLPGGDASNFFPGITIGVTGGGKSLAAIGSFVQAAGQAILDMPPVVFDAGIYEPLPSQIDGWDGAGWWDDYTDAINTATDALSDLNDEVRDFATEQIEALQNVLDSYDDLISKRKELLRTMLAEKKYQDSLAEQQRDIADIRNELIELRLDDSEEARAKRAQLEAELVELERKLADTQLEHGVQQQIQALDADYAAFAGLIAGQIETIGGIDASTVAEFTEKLLAALGFIPTEGMPSSNVPSLIGFNEANNILSSILGGGITDGATSTLPFSFGGAQQPESSYGYMTSIGKLIEINVSGNLDESVIPDIERIAEQVIAKLNEAINLRGITRGANVYSI